ncbi:hypothetical protein [Ketobacter sp.]|uniref:hypothetical protein n=1 Tax=Ketobacter sp. TaxID=2083498 RepID=UPI000F2455B4|nr:hypothetical protein [Ketobacter sp.]RLT96032.1 MAG: hypothetical protein D9N14_14165 [Ketobacter sp.]
MKTAIFAFVCLFTLGLTACDVDEGGAEEAGEKIDEVVTDTGNKVEDLCEDMKQEMNSKDTDC